MPKVKIELKPCPFCGGKASIYKFTKTEAKDLVMKMHYGENEQKEAIEYVLKMPVDTWAIVGCETKECILYANRKKHVSSLFFREQSAEKLAEKWNRRPELNLIMTIPKELHIPYHMGNALTNKRTDGMKIAPGIEIK